MARLQAAEPLRLGPAIITAVGLLLAIAGVFAPTEERAATRSLTARLIVPLPDWLIAVTVAALATASLILIAILFPAPRRPRKKGEEEYEMYYEPRRAPLSVSLLLILLALTPPGILAASIVWLDRNEILLHGHSGGTGSAAGLRRLAPSPSRVEAPTRAASPITADLLGTLALLGGFGSLAVMLWLRFGDRLWRPAFDDERAPANLVEAVEESLEDLRLEPDARAAIIKCYRRFEHSVAAAKLPRPPWQTPVEFMRTALGKLTLPADAVARLTGLFEIARFSHHTVGSAERENALESLTEIRAALHREKEELDAASA